MSENRRFILDEIVQSLTSNKNNESDANLNDFEENVESKEVINQNFSGDSLTLENSKDVAALAEYISMLEKEIVGFKKFQSFINNDYKQIHLKLNKVIEQSLKEQKITDPIEKSLEIIKIYFEAQKRKYDYLETTDTLDKLIILSNENALGNSFLNLSTLSQFLIDNKLQDIIKIEVEKKNLKFNPSIEHADYNENLSREEKAETGRHLVKDRVKPVLRLDLTHKRKRDIKVAVILDEFSFNSFKYEFDSIVIEPHNWLQTFEAEKPDLFFCESAWSGVDSVNRPWKGRIYSSKNFKEENRNELISIIRYCNENGIPTIFWNKEDPTHYTDEVHNFVKTALLFDFIFTTAIECVDKYKKEHGAKHVQALPFATQPIMFNPIKNNNTSTDKVVFAGSWYSNHLQRSTVMAQLFNTIIESGYDLDFYNRYYGDQDESHYIPDEFKKFEKPNVSIEFLHEVYKSSLFGLNINTVTDSETMFARRVFELMSCNTMILSNYSIGIDHFFGENVLFLDKDPKRLKNISIEEVNQICEENLTRVLEHHTYEHRFEEILDAVGVTYLKDNFQVTYVVSISSKRELYDQIDYFKAKLANGSAKLLFIISDKVSDIEIAMFYSEFNSKLISVIAGSYILNYSNCELNTIETPYFIIINDLKELNLDMVRKALLHTTYIKEDYISLFPHPTEKYIFENKFLMNNILAPRKNFGEAYTKFNNQVEDTIYYIASKDNL